jgi:hypothetical protein
LIRKYDVSPSFHAPEASWNRRFTATLKFATAAPFGVYRSSGSSTRFPTMTTWLPLAISITTSIVLSTPPMARRVEGKSCDGRYAARLVTLCRMTSSAR